MSLPPAAIRERVPLAPLTTLGVGGEARFFLDAADEPSLLEALAWAARAGVRTAILGGGSNVLVHDRGVDGLLVRVRILGVTERPDGAGGGASGDRVLLEIGAGEELDPLVERCVRAGYAGIECLSGVPGYVGATPIQNVGAYGQETSEVVTSVRAYRRATGELVTLDNAACRFSYRSSAFKEELRDEHVIARVTFALARGGAPAVRYPELARRLEARGAPADPPSLAAVRAAVLSIRRSKSMVIDPADENRRSAGSFFMNPIVDSALADAIEARAERGGLAMPRFAAGDRVKLSAAWLIEQSGFHKGTVDGPVGISTRHALAIVNRGGATAAQIAGFARKIRDTVVARFGVALVPEPVLLGFSDDEARTLR